MQMGRFSVDAYIHGQHVDQSLDQDNTLQFRASKASTCPKELLVYYNALLG